VQQRCSLLFIGRCMALAAMVQGQDETNITAQLAAVHGVTL
jgi:hypothetical protein